MAKLDDEVKAALIKYGLPQELTGDHAAVWLHKQSGKYIAKHWACEHIALKEGITWDTPVALDHNGEKKIVALLVTGHLSKTAQRDARTEWSIGEAAPYNTSQSYPWAMAEKRGKDRVILKLIGIHGKVYSEEEVDDFRETLANPRDGAGAATDVAYDKRKHDPTSFELFNIAGEVQDVFTDPIAYLNALSNILAQNGNYWIPNEHIVRWIGEHYTDPKIKLECRQIWKLGKEASKNAMAAQQTAEIAARERVRPTAQPAGRLSIGGAAESGATAGSKSDDPPGWVTEFVA